MKTTRQRLLDTLLDRSEIEICHEYGEHGYTLGADKQAILFGDWNKLKNYPNFMRWLETNFELEWGDEWIIDYVNLKAYRTQPDGYGWQQQFRVIDTGELLTPDNDVEEWIEFCQITHETDLERTLNVIPNFIEDSDIINEGFKLLNDDLENGFYGRTDSPNEIAKELLNERHTSVLFRVSEVGPFSINFELFVK